MRNSRVSFEQEALEYVITSYSIHYTKLYDVRVEARSKAEALSSEDEYAYHIWNEVAITK